MVRIFKKSFLIFLMIFLLAFFLDVQEANAYLDPGTGSYIFQVLIAVLLGTIFSLKAFWTKVKQIVISLFKKKKTERGFKTEPREKTHDK